MLGKPDDVRILRQMRHVARDTLWGLELVIGRIDNKQINKVLEECGDNRAALVPRVDAALEELGAPAEDEDGDREFCCTESWFDVSDDANASGDYGPLLGRLAACDEKVRDELKDAVAGADLSGTVRLAADEAILLLGETIKKFRRIIDNGRNGDVGAVA